MSNFTAARKNMIDGQIHPSGVVDASILNVFETVPREDFLPAHIKNIAYQDEDLALGEGRYLMEPVIHARLVQEADLDENHNVLDLGYGCGYSTAILSQLVSTVFALDEDSDLSTNAANVWNDLNFCNIVATSGSPLNGWADNGPYDRIFINGAVAEIPRNIVEQLSVGGRLLCVLKSAGQSMGHAVSIQKTSDENFAVINLFDAATPYLKDFAPKAAFSF